MKIKILTSEDRTRKDTKNDFPDEIEKLEETLFDYIGGIDLKFF